MTDLSALKTLKNIVGLEVKVTNAFNTDTVGTLYAYNIQPVSNLIIQVPNNLPVGNSYNYKVFKTSNITAFEILSDTIDETKIAQVHKVDPNRISKIVERNKDSHELYLQTINEKTTEEGQLIFNAVFKTIPQVRWEGLSIIVLDEVKIDTPYGVESTVLISKASAPEDSDALRLVKKIVDGVWLRIENQRKGG